MEKQTKILAAALLGAALLLTGCGQFKYGAPPTAVDKAFFDVQTNYFPVVKTVTNTVIVPELRTNVVQVTVTNATQIPVTEYRTNVVTVAVTNQVPGLTTNQQPIYSYTENANAAAVRTVGGTAGAPFGVGGLVSGAIGLLFGAWRWVRSAKVGATAATLAQEIETARAFIKMMPNGAIYDSALVQWLSDHQKQTDVVAQVMDILTNSVQSENADVAAAQIKAAIAALNAPAASALATK